MTFKPFYRGPVPSGGVFIEAELIETTRPDDRYRTYAPTGRRRAYVRGWRVPVRFAMFLHAVRWRMA